MGSRSYRRLLTVLEKWPVDVEKSGGRDLGQHIRDQVPRFFPTGDTLSPDSPRSAVECDADLKALEDIVNNKAKNLYARDPVQAKIGCLKLSEEDLRRVTSTEGLKALGGLEDGGSRAALVARVTGFFGSGGPGEEETKKITDKK